MMTTVSLTVGATEAKRYQIWSAFRWWGCWTTLYQEKERVKDASENFDLEYVGQCFSNLIGKWVGWGRVGQGSVWRGGVRTWAGEEDAGNSEKLRPTLLCSQPAQSLELVFLFLRQEQALRGLIWSLLLPTVRAEAAVVIMSIWDNGGDCFPGRIVLITA